MESFTLIKISPDELKSIITSSVKAVLHNYLEDYTQGCGNGSVQHSINLETLCKLYDWKKATVYGWVHDSLIPHSKVGKRLYFSIAEIEKWIASGRRKTILEIQEEADSCLAKKGYVRRHP